YVGEDRARVGRGVQPDRAGRQAGVDGGQDRLAVGVHLEQVADDVDAEVIVTAGLVAAGGLGEHGAGAAVPLHQPAAAELLVEHDQVPVLAADPYGGADDIVVRRPQGH